MNKLIESQIGLVISEWKKNIRECSELASFVGFADTYDTLLTKNYKQLVKEITIEVKGGKPSKLAAALNPESYLNGMTALAKTLAA